MNDNVVELDDYRAVEEVVKLRINAKHVVICAEFKNGELLTYIPPEVSDIILVYMIQTLQDRRARRVYEINS